MVYRIGEHEGRTVDIQILSRSAPGIARSTLYLRLAKYGRRPAVTS
jgi:hypothetical protein